MGGVEPRVTVCPYPYRSIADQFQLVPQCTARIWIIRQRFDNLSSSYSCLLFIGCFFCWFLCVYRQIFRLDMYHCTMYNVHAHIARVKTLPMTVYRKRMIYGTVNCLYICAIFVQLWCASGVVHSSPTDCVAGSGGSNCSGVSEIWVCATVEDNSCVMIVDANHPATPLDEFIIPAAHVLCITSVPGAHVFRL